MCAGWTHLGGATADGERDERRDQLAPAANWPTFGPLGPLGLQMSGAGQLASRRARSVAQLITAGGLAAGVPSQLIGCGCSGRAELAAWWRRSRAAANCARQLRAGGPSWPNGAACARPRIWPFRQTIWCAAERTQKGPKVKPAAGPKVMRPSARNTARDAQPAQEHFPRQNERPSRAPSLLAGRPAGRPHWPP